jgi:hypothetical protein
MLNGFMARWLLGGVVFLCVGFVLRRLLGLDAASRRVCLSLDGERERLYQTIVLELQTQSAILAVSLNDAIEECESGNHEIAWRLLRLTTAEWNRLAEILRTLLGVVVEYLPVAGTVVPIRSIAPKYFKSETMIDYVRLHEWLDQFLWRARLRFHLQVRVLRHAVEALTDDFRRIQPQSYALPADLWSQLDRDFHDFDLITKEVLLAFRTFLTSLPERAVSDFRSALLPIIERGVRSAPAGVAT